MNGRPCGESRGRPEGGDGACRGGWAGGVRVTSSEWRGLPTDGAVLAAVPCGSGQRGLPRTAPGGSGWHGLCGSYGGPVTRCSRCSAGELSGQGGLSPHAGSCCPGDGTCSPPCWFPVHAGYCGFPSLGYREALIITATMFSSSSDSQVSFTTVDSAHLALLFYGVPNIAFWVFNPNRVLPFENEYSC